MEGVLAVLRPKGAVKSDYRLRSYDILLLESKAPHPERGTAAKYLPMFTLRLTEDEPREVVLTQLFKLTKGENGQGIKGERAILVPHSRHDEARGSRESLSRFSLFCVPVSQHEKLSKRHVDAAHNNPGFYSLESVFEMVNSGSVSFPSQTRSLLLQLDSWLREKHTIPGVVEALFQNRAEYRVRLTIHNPVFLPSRVSPDEEGPEAEKYAEIQLSANEARAKMLSIEKCDIVVINPLFGSGLPYKTKVNRHLENSCWPQQPDYSKIVVPDLAPEVPRWREKYPVHSMAAEGNVDAVKELISQGYSHSKKDSISWAPIHYAAWFGNPAVVKALLESGCSVNIQDLEEKTPLHIAARKGHPGVVKVLLLNRGINIDALDKKGHTPLQMCESGPDHTWKHEKVASYIKQAWNRPRPEIPLHPRQQIPVKTMDNNVFYLDLTSGYDTSVEQLNEQMLNEFAMPMEPYAQIFTTWICSRSLELQLKGEHKAISQLENWKSRTVGMLSDANPDQEEPVLKWRRNAKIGVEIEKQVIWQLTHKKAIDLLFHEAYYNYINALYPCKEQDAVTFAAILFLLWNGHLDSTATKSYLSNTENLQKLVPQPIYVNKGATHWATKIVREINHSKDRMPLALKRQFLSRCHHLTVYGSAFFTGSVQGLHQGSRSSGGHTKCHIGVNDVGIHIINAQSKAMMHSYKYSEIEWKHNTDYSILEIHVTRPEGKSQRNGPKTVTKVRSKQAGLIKYLMKKLAEMHERERHARDVP